MSEHDFIDIGDGLDECRICGLIVEKGIVFLPCDGRRILCSINS